MAIAFDAAGGRSFSASSNSLTYSHTCTGTNRYLLVCVKTSTTDDVSGITYNSVSMTQIGKVQNPGGDSRWAYMYYLINPASGANNVVVSTSDTPDFIIAKSTSFTGVKQSGQPDASTTGTVAVGTSITLSITTIADNCWSAMYVIDTNAPAASTNVTDRHSDGTPETLGDTNAVVSPAGNISQTMTDSLRSFAGIQSSFSPFVASTTVVPNPTLLTLQVG